MRKTGLYLAVGLLGLAGLCGIAQADIINASETTYAYQHAPDSPQGSPENLLVGYWWNTRIAYMKFDLSGYTIPTNHQVDSAKLKVVWSYSSDGTCNGDTFTAFVGDDSWSETTLTYNNKPSYGAELDRTTWVPYNYASLDVTDVFKTEMDGDGTLSLAVFSDAGAEFVYLGGRNHSTSTRRPVLEIATSEIPEPATMGLLTAGGLLTLVRRRR